MMDFFADVMTISDFVGFDAIGDQANENPENMRTAIAQLGKYAPVMLTYYEPYEHEPNIMDGDLKAIMDPGFLGEQVRKGLFAFAFTDDATFAQSPVLEARAEQAVRTFGRPDSARNGR